MPARSAMPPMTPIAMPAFAPPDMEDDEELVLPPELLLPDEEPPLDDPPFPLFAPLDSWDPLGLVDAASTATDPTQLFAVSIAMIFGDADFDCAWDIVNSLLSWLTVRTAEEKNMPPIRGIMPSPGAMRTMGICLLSDRVSTVPEFAM